MSNIIRIFISDARRLATNVVAIVVIMGLTVIPCLYAWFNIFSNWDPYGPKATGKLQVAVASSDSGTDIETFHLNIGSLVIDNLKQNKTINWQFPKDSNKAIEGVRSGKYYAALIIDKDFTANMISFLGGDPRHPAISYYENEKKNAIAPKITGKVKTTVQEEVNHAFISTLASTLVQVSNYAVSTNQKDQLTGNALLRMKQMDQDLTVLTTVLDSYMSLIDSAKSLSDASAAVTEELGKIADNGRLMVDHSSDAL
ncbi:MAG: YhgE/Pip family protein, partial [Lachnospiraceae bacterium]|nr:YhgE/Pip family protein [Lachnospiraceae bacterium]